MTLTIERLAAASRWTGRAVLEKAVLALGLLVLAVSLPPWPGAMLVLVAAWALALMGAGLRAADWARLNAVPMGFVLTGMVALAVQVDGGGIGLAPDHGLAALLTGLRAAAATACLLLLAATTPAADLVRGLRRLGLPADLADIMMLMWRFVFQLMDAAGAIRAAQEARLGWNGWWRSIRSLGLLVALLLPRAMETARRLEIGLAARGFDGALPVLAASRPASVPVVAAILTAEILLAGGCLWLG